MLAEIRLEVLRCLNFHIFGGTLPTQIKIMMTLNGGELSMTKNETASLSSSEDIPELQDLVTNKWDQVCLQCMGFEVTLANIDYKLLLWHVASLRLISFFVSLFGFFFPNEMSWGEARIKHGSRSQGFFFIARLRCPLCLASNELKISHMMGSRSEMESLTAARRQGS